VRSARDWWRAFRRPEAEPSLLEETALSLVRERKHLVHALRRWRKSAFQRAILARALLEIGHSEKALAAARRATRELLRGVLRDGGQLPAKRREALCRVFLLLGEVYQRLEEAEPADRSFAASLFCARAALEVDHDDRLFAEVWERVRAGHPLKDGSLVCQEIAAAASVMGDPARRAELRAAIRGTVGTEGGECDDARAPAQRPADEDEVSPMRRFGSWLTGSPGLRRLPQILGAPEAEWTRMQLWGGLRKIGPLFLLSACIFIVGEVVCHVLAERALDQMLEHAALGFLPGPENGGLLDLQMRTVFLAHAFLVALLALPVAWWVLRVSRTALATPRFGTRAVRPKIAARAVAGLSLAVVAGCAGLIHLRTNTFRTVFTVPAALRATMSPSPEQQSEALLDLAGDLDFRARNQLDNYLRILLALHFERLRDYDSSVRLWSRASRRAYFPLPSQVFFEYEAQVGRRLAMMSEYERRLSTQPEDAAARRDFGSYLLCHKRFARALDLLTRALQSDPQGGGLFSHELSVPEAVDLLYKNTRHIVSSDDRGLDVAAGFLEAVAATKTIHRLGWAVQEARSTPAPWAAEQFRRLADAAVDAVEELCARHAENAVVQLNLAEFLSLVRRHRGADAAFSRLEQLGELDAGGYTTWAGTLYALRKYQSACSKFTEAAERSGGKPLVGDALVKWAWSLAWTDRRADAEEKFLEALKQEPDESKYYYQYGKALNYWEEHEAAVEQFRKATAGTWPYRAAYAPWADSLNQLGRSAEAVKFAGRAIRYRAKRRSTYAELVVRTLRGLPDEHYGHARDELAGVVHALRTEISSSWLPDLYLARAFAELGDPHAAARLLYQLELFVPWQDRLGWITRSSSDYALWGWAYLDAERPGMAVGKFRAALRADPQNLDARRGLGLACAKSGELAEADESFARARNLAGGRLGTLLAGWAEAKECAGDHTGAADLYGEALEVGWRGDGAGSRYVQALVLSGRGAEALDWLRRQREDDGANALSDREAVPAMMLLGRWEEAERALDRELVNSPRSNSGHRLAGLIRLGARDFARAAERLGESIARGNRDPLLPLFRWIAQSHADRQRAGADAFPGHLARAKHRYWPMPVYRLCLGQVSEQELIERAGRRVSAKEHADRLSLAHYVLGELSLLAGDVAGAKRHLEQCLAQGRFALPQHALANRVLSTLP